MVVGGVVVGCGKNLKLNFPKAKDVTITKINPKNIVVEFYIEDYKNTNKCYKNLLCELIKKPAVGKVYTIDRIKFLRTIIF